MEPKPDAEFERSLSTQLARAAAAMPLNSDALGQVRERPLRRNRRPAVALAVASAAAVLAVAVVSGALSQETPSVNIETAGDPGSRQGSPEAVAGGEEAVADAVLVAYGYPNSTSEDMAGQWLMLTTDEWTYYWRDPPAGAVDAAETRIGQRLQVVKSTADLPVDEALDALAATAADAALDELPSGVRTQDDTDRDRYMFRIISETIESGMTSPAHIERLFELLSEVPAVHVVPLDGDVVRATFTPDGSFVVGDAATGHPVESAASSDPGTVRRVISITEVVAAAVLDDAAQDQQDTHLTPSTTMPTEPTSSSGNDAQ